MPFLQAIQKIISAFIPEFKFVNKGTIILTCFSNNNNGKLAEIRKIDDDNLTLNLDINKASHDEIKKLMEIYPEIKEQNELILQQDNYYDLRSYLEEIREIPLLKYFKSKLNDADYEALRTSIFIRNKFDNGGEVTNYLDQLYKKFGVRGRNICNLYGEGYFDNFIKPFYAMLESEKRINEFKEQFDKFVMEQPISYFVNQHKPQEQVNQELINKITNNKKYGIKRLNIHGIGEVNTKKIKQFIKIIENRTDLRISSLIEKDKRISVSLEIF